MESHHLQSFRPSGSGGVILKADNAAMTSRMVEVKKERKRPANEELAALLSPRINLGLEIGTNSVGKGECKAVIVQPQGESVLTIGQLHELQRQVLIHKYLAAGLHVPTQLLIPNRRSAARTLGSGANGIYEPHRSFIGFSSLGFDYKSMMDPEPERCRRTDGKKWRCGRTTVPHQKYCERHMHRGRQRSRKPVEVSEIDSASNTTLHNNPDRDVGCVVDAPTIATGRNNETKNHFNCEFIPFPFITEAATPSPSNMQAKTAILTSCATLTVSVVPASVTNITSTRVTTIPSMNPTATTRIDTSNVVDMKDVCSMDYGENCNKKRRDLGRNNINVQKMPSPGLGFSPNSVLQVPGCSNSRHDSKIMVELEPGRCRRTDGKKWRCRRDVIPNQKYCGLHMHRGSKKHLNPSQKVTVFSTSAATSSITLIPSATTRLAKPGSLNTNLSMSIRGGDDKQRHNEEKSDVSSSSETTITDTTITAYENISS